ncbi:DUF397 domain-containing protein [Nocardia sp. NPDC057227]|uniref:DUF397 domain-containing protein n=1 Tax=Nocardia sp. NPDC057227 TaxID=3346056 RepID=UPI00363239CE
MEHEPSGLTFRKSTYSQAEGECVEVAEAPNGDRYVRDSKNPDAGTLHFTAGEWTAFKRGVLSGEF